MNANQQLWILYNKFYQQRSVLQSAPQLSINVDVTSPEEFDYRLAEQEMNLLLGYLLGVPDASRLKVPDALSVVRRSYDNQPFWRELILDYLTFRTQKTTEALRDEAAALREKGVEILQQIRREEAKRNAVVEAFSAAIEKEHFAVDAKKLIRAYLNMRRMDAAKAWEILTTNPGFFAPIITTDSMGRKTLTPEKAIEENKRLAKFLKSLKV